MDSLDGYDELSGGETGNTSTRRRGTTTTPRAVRSGSLLKIKIQAK